MPTLPRSRLSNSHLDGDEDDEELEAVSPGASALVHASSLFPTPLVFNDAVGAPRFVTPMSSSSDAAEPNEVVDDRPLMYGTTQRCTSTVGLNTDDERLSRDDDAGPDPAIASPPRLVRVPVPGDEGELTPPSATRSLSMRPPTPLLTVRRHPQPQPHCTTHSLTRLCPFFPLQAAQLARFNNANRPQPAMARRQRRRRKVTVHAATADAGTMLTGMQQHPIGK